MKNARALACASLLLAACHHDTKAGNGDDMGVGDGGGDDGFNLDAFVYDHDGGLPDGYVVPPGADGGIPIPGPDGGTVLCYITPCQGHVYQCGDCKDNDGDGLIDSFDPDCLGACQNNEAGFLGNIPGQNNAPCKSDCYWDQDTGSGNDDCYWSHSCDPFEQGGTGYAAGTSPEIGCTYDANAKVSGAHVPAGQKDCAYLLNNQSDTCHKVCGTLTPNGCDCFGCCEDPNRPGNYVYAGSVNSSGQGTCDPTAAALADVTKCKPCTPVAGCLNTCAHCELCFGKTTLPMDCYMSVPDMAGQPPSTDMAGQPPPPPPQMCPTGEQACGLPGQSPCPPGNYCLTGCCAPLIL
jgi:hypothetical protein